MPTDKDIADKLEDFGYGTVGEDIFYSYMPAEPVDCISVIQTGGLKPAPWERLEYPGIQIIIRNEDPDTAREIADGILADIGGIGHFTINDTIYHYIEPTSSPNDVGMDEQNRKIFTISFIVTKDMEG